MNGKIDPADILTVKADVAQALTELEEFINGSHIEIDNESTEDSIREQLQDKSDNVRSVLDDLNKSLEAFQNNLNTKVITQILSSCGSIRQNIDLLEKGRDIRKKPHEKDPLFKYHGIRSDGNEKVSIYLTGGFGAGKTTFLQRILGTLAGAIGPFPETGTQVKHSGSDGSYFKIKFKDEFEIVKEDNKKFAQFLKYHTGMSNKFLQNNTTWTKVQGADFTEKWDTSECVMFINEINKYPGCVESIEWMHKIPRYGKGLNILEYADIYDLPGIGGKDQHDQFVEKVISESNPDIVLYLVDTDMGLPPENEMEFIKRWIMTIVQDKPWSQFLWLFQKKGTNIDQENWLEEKRDSIRTITEKIAQKCFDERFTTDGADDALVLRGEITDYFETASVIDARGDVKDTSSAQKAIAMAIGNYFVVRLEEYLEESKGLLENVPNLDWLQSWERSVEETKEKTKNPTIKSIDFVKALINNPHISQDEFKKDFKHNLGIEELCLTDRLMNPLDSSAVAGILVKWNKEISEMVNQITNAAKQRNDQNTKDLIKDQWEKLTGEQRNNIWNLDLNYCVTKFNDDLKKDNDWVEKLYLGQAALLLKAYHENTLAGFYIKDIESKIISIIENELERLKRILVES